MRALVDPLQGVYSAAIVYGSGGAYAQANDKQADAYNGATSVPKSATNIR